jgi:hypothetical protein
LVFLGILTCALDRKFKYRSGKESLRTKDPVGWITDAFDFTMGTATRACITLPIFKNIAASQTLGRSDYKLFSFCIDSTANMSKMLIHLFFPDPHLLGHFPGAHLLFFQKPDHLLAYGLHSWPRF